jgi:hypothetical protein
MESVAGAAPDGGDTPIQLALAEAVQDIDPPPVFVIETLCAAGKEAPTV